MARKPKASPAPIVTTPPQQCEPHCPTCKRPFKLDEPQRLCYQCRQPIGRGDKWQWVTISIMDGLRASTRKITTIQHRNCKDTQSYTIKETSDGKKV